MKEAEAGIKENERQYGMFNSQAIHDAAPEHVERDKFQPGDFDDKETKLAYENRRQMESENKREE